MTLELACNSFPGDVDAADLGTTPDNQNVRASLLSLSITENASVVFTAYKLKSKRFIQEPLGFLLDISQSHKVKPLHPECETSHLCELSFPDLYFTPSSCPILPVLQGPQILLSPQGLLSSTALSNDTFPMTLSNHCYLLAVNWAFLGCREWGVTCRFSSACGPQPISSTQLTLLTE